MSPALVTLPCNCVVDWARDSVHSEDKHVIRCDWCGCDFHVEDLAAWFESGSHAVWVQRAYPLVSCEDKLLEVIGICSGQPMLRERNNRESHIHLGWLPSAAKLAN